MGPNPASVTSGYMSESFHSTDCPSEWGHTEIDENEEETGNYCFHSTDCPSEWGPFTESHVALAIDGFHSTDCPSEWGPSYYEMKNGEWHRVSIQLIAPASGAGEYFANRRHDYSRGFPFN